MGTNLFANIDPELYEAVQAAAELSNLSKRTLVEGMIAHMAGLDHDAKPAAVRAFAKLKKSAR